MMRVSVCDTIPPSLEDTAAVKGEIARYETADQSHAGSTASIENPAATPLLGRRPANGLVDFANSFIAADGAAGEGEHAEVENPAPITRLGYIVSNRAVGQGRNALVHNTAAHRGSRIVGDGAPAHHQLAAVLNATGTEAAPIIRDGTKIDLQRAARPDPNPEAKTAGIIGHSTMHQGPGAGRYRDTLFIIGHHAVFNG